MNLQNAAHIKKPHKHAEPITERWWAISQCSHLPLSQIDNKIRENRSI